MELPGVRLRAMNVAVIELTDAADLDAVAYEAIVYGGEAVAVSPTARERVAESRRCLVGHLATGVICYGVTTGLGAQTDVDLTAEQMSTLPRHTVIGRASASGPPLPLPVGRGALLAKLVQFLGGRSGVSVDLCDVIVDRLNRGMTPVVPSRGHGAAGEIIALAHIAQTLLGEGTVVGTADAVGASGVAGPVSAAAWHEANGIARYKPQPKEGLSLISGTAAGPAYAWHLARRAGRALDQATLVAAASIEGLAAPMSPYSVRASEIAGNTTVAAVMAQLRDHLAGSGVTRHARQAPVSYRVTPQTHATAVGAIADLATVAMDDMRSNGDNPAFFADPSSPAFGELVSNGNFHGAALAAEVEATTSALVHVGVLAEKRLYRLLDERSSGLDRQLAAVPGLDAGLITVHKAALDHSATLRTLAAPVTHALPDSSFGQEDVQAMTIPALRRLAEAIDLVALLSAHELYVAAVAIDRRGERPGDDVGELVRRLRTSVAPYDGDRSYGPDLQIGGDWLRVDP